MYRFKFLVVSMAVVTVFSSSWAVLGNPVGARADSASESVDSPVIPEPDSRDDASNELDAESPSADLSFGDSQKIGGDNNLGTPLGGIQTRVVGGEAKAISYSPWQVALVDTRWGPNDYQGFFCGGSIISPDWIVTAAHCFDTTNTATIRVVAGNAVLSSSSLSTVTVSRIILHPSYNPRTAANDVALLKLSNPLNLNPEVIETIALPSGKPGSGTSARITGWGSTWCSDGFLSYNDDNFLGCGPPDPSDQFPTNLQGANVFVQSDRTCLSELGRSFNSRSMLCASTPDYWQDTCQGDSGGPLAIQVGETWVLAGVTSWGFGCAWQSSGVYTNVANYRQWITSVAPLPGVEPTTSDPIGTPTGFTFTVTNFDPATRYQGTLESGSGRVRVGKANGSTLPITVTGVAPGFPATVRVTAVKVGYTNTHRSISSSADPLPTSDVRLVSDEGTRFSLEVTNYNPSYRYSVQVVSGAGRATIGRAIGSTLPLAVMRALPDETVRVRIAVSLGKGASNSVTFVRNP